MVLYQKQDKKKQSIPRRKRGGDFFRSKEKLSLGVVLRTLGNPEPALRGTVLS